MLAVISHRCANLSHSPACWRWSPWVRRLPPPACRPVFCSDPPLSLSSCQPAPWHPSASTLPPVCEHIDVSVQRSSSLKSSILFLIRWNIDLKICHVFNTFIHFGYRMIWRIPTVDYDEKLIKILMGRVGYSRQPVLNFYLAKMHTWSSMHLK